MTSAAAAVAATTSPAVDQSFTNARPVAHTSKSTSDFDRASIHIELNLLYVTNGFDGSKLTEIIKRRRGGVYKMVERRRGGLFVASVNEMIEKGVSGMLYQFINYVKGWRPRWFVLHDGVLLCYKIHGADRIKVSPDTTRPSQVRLPLKPLAEIHLKVSSIQESRSDDTKFTIFTGTEMLHLRAGSYGDCKAWVSVLKSVKSTFPTIELMIYPISTGLCVRRINEILGKGLSGILYMWINYLKGWQPRWFVLHDGVLSYYKIHCPDRNGCRLVSKNKDRDTQHRPPQKPLGEIHLKVSSIEKNRTDHSKFTIFTGTKMLHLRVCSYGDCPPWMAYEDRLAWVGPLDAIKSMFGLLSSPADTTISIEQLRQRILEEGFIS